MRNIKMYSIVLSAAAVAVLLMAGGAWAAGAQEVEATIVKDHVEIRVAGDLFTVYKTLGSPQLPTQKYPFFYPVNGPLSGKSVTVETVEPYPHHHSLFFGCDRVNGGNYWQAENETGQIVSQGPKIIQGSGEQIVFTEECLWRKPGQEPIIRDKRRITIQAPSAEQRIIDFDVTLHPLTDIRIEKTNHSFFSARVMPELSVNSSGTLVNAEGDSGEKATFGKNSPWMDYSGTRDSKTEGIAILQHPGNRWYPSKWFTRDYGFFSPTPMYWPEGSRTELAEGEALRLRYRVVVHAGNAEAAGIAKLFKEYAAEK